MKLTAPRQFRGFRIAGLCLLYCLWSPDGRRLGISYHHPKRMCWLWMIEARLRKGIKPRFVHLPGYQAQTYIDIPFVTIFFSFQEEGRYTDPSDQRVRRLLGVKQWPKSAALEQSKEK